jgi:glutathione S-transferase
MIRAFLLQSGNHHSSKGRIHAYSLFMAHAEWSQGSRDAGRMQWLMFQMGGVGPMIGQTHHFKIRADLRRPITDDKAREVLFGKTQYEKR